MLKNYALYLVWRPSVTLTTEGSFSGGGDKNPSFHYKKWPLGRQHFDSKFANYVLVQTYLHTKILTPTTHINILHIIVNIICQELVQHDPLRRVTNFFDKNLIVQNFSCVIYILVFIILSIIWYQNVEKSKIYRDNTLLWRVRLN